MRIFRRKKVNFQNKNLVICKMGIITEKEENYEYIEWKSEELTKNRILIMGRNSVKFYEPDGIKAYYGNKYAYKAKVKIGDLIVKAYTTPIQYHPEAFKFTEEEERTKTIMLERIKEIENLLNSN